MWIVCSFLLSNFISLWQKKNKIKNKIRKKLTEDSRSSLYPSKKRPWALLYCIEKIPSQRSVNDAKKKKKEKRKKIELSTFRREPSHRASTSPSAKRILDENTLLVQCIIIIFILFSYVFPRNNIITLSFVLE